MSWFVGPSIVPVFRRQKQPPRDKSKSRAVRAARVQNLRSRAEFVGAINRAQRHGRDAAEAAEKTYGPSLKELLRARKPKKARSF